MAKKKETFESLMERLEDIVNNMDMNNLTLEEAIKYYEEGIKLSNKLYGILNSAETKIKILTDEGEKIYLQEEE